LNFTKQYLSPIFSRLCDPLSDNNDDISNFAQSAAGNFMGVVQYNKDNRKFEVKDKFNVDVFKPVISSS
jgi:hypothetical protein